MPGLEVVGRGVYLRPDQPYELKQVLFPRSGASRRYHSEETGHHYTYPEGYELNNSPPMPNNQAHNQVQIDESWMSFDQRLSLDSQVAGGNGVFTINANLNMSRQLHSKEESYYASRNSFIPLWTVYVTSTQSIVNDAIKDMDIPTPFEYKHRARYQKVFDRVGTHYVKRAWVGGSATVVFKIAKTSQMTKREIQSGIKASFGKQEGNLNVGMKEDQERLMSHSECTVFGNGGDELALAGLNTLDEEVYNQWLNSIKHNPQVISLAVAGIWTLVDDADKAKALMSAYTAATTFGPLSSIFSIEQNVYLLRNNYYFVYDTDSHESSKPVLIKSRWPELDKIGFDRIDSAFCGAMQTDEHGASLDRKVFLFRKGDYVRMDADTNIIDEGYPQAIQDGWPGIPFDRIDAVLNAGPGALYLFCGGQYVRFDMARKRVDEGYPQLIRDRWEGVTFERIDAATMWGNAKVYFFYERNYIRYDMTTYSADHGYPKFISSEYVADWKFFD